MSVELAVYEAGGLAESKSEFDYDSVSPEAGELMRGAAKRLRRAAGNVFFALGEELSAVKRVLSDSGGNTSATFAAWAEAELRISKSHAYAAVRVYERLDPWRSALSGVQIAALNRLAANDVDDVVVERVAEAVRAAGQSDRLDRNWLDAVLARHGVGSLGPAEGDAGSGSEPETAKTGGATNPDTGGDAEGEESVSFEGSRDAPGPKAGPSEKRSDKKSGVPEPDGLPGGLERRMANGVQWRKVGGVTRVYDASGFPVPDDLADLFGDERWDCFDDQLLARLSAFLRTDAAKAGAPWGSPTWFEGKTDLARCADMIRAAVVANRPTYVCRPCGGKGCADCRGTGWLPAARRE